MGKNEKRAYREACLILADRAMGDAMRQTKGCPRAAEKIKEAQFLLDDALELSNKNQ